MKSMATKVQTPKKRKLIDGSREKEFNKEIKLTISSKCPNKWAFVDMETKDIWVYKERHSKNTLFFTFHRADNKALKMVKTIADYWSPNDKKT